MLKKVKIHFELNGFCEHCKTIAGPGYFTTHVFDTEPTQRCITCASHDGLDEKIYQLYELRLSNLRDRWRAQEAELKQMEKDMGKPKLPRKKK